MNTWRDNDNHILVQLLKIKLRGHRSMGGGGKQKGRRRALQNGLRFPSQPSSGNSTTTLRAPGSQRPGSSDFSPLSVTSQVLAIPPPRSLFLPPLPVAMPLVAANPGLWGYPSSPPPRPADGNRLPTGF